MFLNDEMSNYNNNDNCVCPRTDGTDKRLLGMAENDVIPLKFVGRQTFIHTWFWVSRLPYYLSTTTRRAENMHNDKGNRMVHVMLW